MIEIRPRETVILATDFATLVSWYKEALGFAVTRDFGDEFNYCNLETPTGIRIGIGDASEMGMKPTDRSQNTVVLQLEVDDVPEFFEALASKGATITSGPSADKSGDFWFGRFSDPEGNPIWVVDKNCP